MGGLAVAKTVLKIVVEFFGIDIRIGAGYNAKSAGSLVRKKE